MYAALKSNGVPTHLYVTTRAETSPITLTTFGD
jgi:hypothetical protein